MIKRCLLICCFSFGCLLLSAQELVVKPHFGGSIGLTFNLGTVMRRVGLQIAGYYARDRVQFNAQSRLFYNFRSFGPPQSHPECQIRTGFLWAYGARDTTLNRFINAVSNQTGRRNSLAYAYNWYLEKWTRQNSGTLALQFDALEIITENDALAGEGQDKFRTGALQIAYRFPYSRLALQTILWTGNTHGNKVNRVENAGDYPCRFGYKDLSKAHCGRFSHGILALQYQRYFAYGQSAGASIGIDSERVRHFLQNRFIHDMPFIPATWTKTKNPHYPMLDSNGDPYLFREGQKLRPLRFFFDFMGNGTLFY